MMDVKMIFTVQGQIVGELVSSSPLQLKNPCIVIPNENGVNFVPLHALVDDKVFTVNPDMLLFQEAKTPVMPIVNKFSELFGSGIQIVSSI